MDSCRGAFAHHCSVLPRSRLVLHQYFKCCRRLLLPIQWSAEKVNTYYNILTGIGVTLILIAGAMFYLGHPFLAVFDLICGGFAIYRGTFDPEPGETTHPFEEKDK